MGLVLSGALACGGGSGAQGAEQQHVHGDAGSAEGGPDIEQNIDPAMGDPVAPGRSPDDAGAPGPTGGFVSTLSPLEPGEPITDVRPNEWTWIDVPEARCMGDDPTGMHFNLGDPTKLAILMEGGGACYNSATCVLSLAIHPFGATAADTALITEVYGNNLFNRDDPDNPIRDYSFVFFPYCSGDVFAGAAQNGTGFEGRTMQGYYNVRAYLRRLIATFPGADKVLLTGVSAGGFGAAFNFDQVQEAFGQATRVYLLDDSGPPLPTTQMTPCLQERWREAWKLDDMMPAQAECPGCRNARSDVGIMNMVAYIKRKYPDRRLGVISASQDLVIREFFGYGLDECASLDPPLGIPLPTTPVPGESYEAGLRELFDYSRAIEGATMEGFIVRGAEGHTFLLSPNAFREVEVDGVTLGAWLANMLDDDPSWTTLGND
jgi:hypothetical protein